MSPFALTIILQRCLPARCQGIVISYLKNLFYHLRSELVETHAVQGCKVENEWAVPFFGISVGQVVEGYF